MKITTLFLDIGGVFLTNGWDRSLREKAASHYGLSSNEIDERHRLMFDAYESGGFSLNKYLEKTIFYEPRSFSMDEFKSFMFNSAKSYPEMLDFFIKLKKSYNLKVAFVSNEGRELAEDRVSRFNLKDLGDFFVVSSFFHCRKPDLKIYKIAMDLSQASPQEILYIDDRKLFVEMGRGLGLNAIHHINLESTKEELKKFFK